MPPEPLHAGRLPPARNANASHAPSKKHVPPLSGYLPAEDRRELPGRLKKMAAAEEDPAVKDVLDRVRAALAKPGAKATLKRL